MAGANEAQAAAGAELSFEDALARLETIVDQLESGELTLEDSLKRYEEGMKLSRRLGRTLDEAEKTIERLVETAGDDGPSPASPPAARAGKPRTRPMELEVETGKSSDSELPF